MAPFFAPRPRADRTFERIYRRHAGDVYRYAYAVLQNRSDAEDVTQTTFLNAYRALTGGQRPATPHHWLIAIAHNVCRQRFRQSQRRPNEVAWQDDIAERLVSDDETPTGDDLRRALSHLSFNQRTALVLRELEGRSYAEIAVALELSVSAVETLIFRARRALREQLEGAFTCVEAEQAISRQLDGRLSRTDKGALRAHLRECPECATLARRQRAQRTALKTLGSIPLPMSLASLFGGGGGTAASVVAAKAAVVVAATAVAGGASYETVHHVVHHQRPARVAAAQAAQPPPRPVLAPTPHLSATPTAQPERGPGGNDGGRQNGESAGHGSRSQAEVRGDGRGDGRAEQGRRSSASGEDEKRGRDQRGNASKDGHKFSGGTASQLSDVPSSPPRNSAARGFRGTRGGAVLAPPRAPWLTDPLASPERKETHGSGQSPQRGHRVGRPQARQASGDEEGTGGSAGDGG